MDEKLEGKPIRINGPGQLSLSLSFVFLSIVPDQLRLGPQPVVLKDLSNRKPF